MPARPGRAVKWTNRRRSIAAKWARHFSALSPEERRPRERPSSESPIEPNTRLPHFNCPTPSYSLCSGRTCPVVTNLPYRLVRATDASSQPLSEHEHRGNDATDRTSISHQAAYSALTPATTFDLGRGTAVWRPISPPHRNQRFARSSRRREASGEPNSLAFSYQLRAFPTSALMPQKPSWASKIGS
jgi:hypothetical protein